MFWVLRLRPPLHKPVVCMGPAVLTGFFLLLKHAPLAAPVLGSRLMALRFHCVSYLDFMI